MGDSEQQIGLVGALDEINHSHVTGWAHVGHDPATVTIAFDDVIVGQAVANQLRPDLFSAGLGNLNRGFSLPVPADLKMRRDTRVTASVENVPLHRSGTAVGELLTDRSILFDRNGDRIVSEVVLQGHFLIEGMLGKYGETFNLDVLAPFVAAATSAHFMNMHLSSARRYSTAREQLRQSVARTEFDGLFLEFGVWSGGSINEIARQRPTDTIYGFDSFQGLPEDWTVETGAGAFATPHFPTVLPNVELVVGWFNQTLPHFCSEHASERIAFLHIDCDLYSSTKTVFDNLAPMIGPGTVIVFDEYFNYPGWEQHEHRAFTEFLERTGFRCEYQSVVPAGHQLCVKIADGSRAA